MANLLDDVKLSIQLEENGYTFYKETADKVANPLAKATLMSLAQRELVHMERIKELYAKLTNQGTLKDNWLNDAAVTPSKGELIAPIIEKLRTSLGKKFEVSSDITEAYKIAEGLEADSYHLYDKIAQEGVDEITTKFYSALATEEREHYTILDETLQYLNNPGDWFKNQEKWIVEG